MIYARFAYENNKQVVHSKSVSEPRPEEKTLSIFTARGRRAFFQLVFTSDEPFLLTVSDEPSGYAGGMAETVRLSLSVEGSIPASASVIGYTDDDNGLATADPILRDQSVYVNAREPRAVWVALDISPELAPGVYGGSVTLWRHCGFTSEKKAETLSFTVEVLAPVLPPPSERRFYLDLWQHTANIARKHEAALWSDRHFAVLERYVESLAALGQKAVTVIASDMPWSGQGSFTSDNAFANLYEYSMIGVEKRADGSLSCDFTACDRYVDLCAKHGIDREIEVFGLINVWTYEEFGFGKAASGGEYDDGVRVRCKNPDGSFGYLTTDAEIAAYFKAVADHFCARGLIDRVRVVADEPSDSALYLKRRAFLEEAAPAFRYKAAVFDAAFIEAASGGVSDFVPIFNGVASDPARMFRCRDALREAGKRLLWYVCCGPKLPNTFLRSSLAESYAIGLLTSYMDFDGFLRWNYTVWPDEPRKTISYRRSSWPAGDTCFVYPAADGSPLLSLRYFALLRGIEFFTLVDMAKKKLGPAAEDLLSRVYGFVMKTSDLSDFNRADRFGDVMSEEYADYAAAERLLLDALS